jgi:hypothetical protein
MIRRPTFARTAETDEVKLAVTMRFDGAATRFASDDYPNSEQSTFTLTRRVEGLKGANYLTSSDWPARGTAAGSRAHRGGWRMQPRRQPAPVVSTRLRAPALDDGLISRERLIDLLQAGRTKRLVLIHGPAGFGKTTLAVQWQRVLIAEGVPVAWLTLGRDDNDAGSFLGHLVEAVRGVGCWNKSPTMPSVMCWPSWSINAPNTAGGGAGNSHDIQLIA